MSQILKLGGLMLALFAIVVLLFLFNSGQTCPPNSIEMKLSSSSVCMCSTGYECFGDSCQSGTLLNTIVFGFPVSCVNCHCRADKVIKSPLYFGSAPLAAVSFPPATTTTSTADPLLVETDDDFSIVSQTRQEKYRDQLNDQDQTKDSTAVISNKPSSSTTTTAVVVAAPVAQTTTTTPDPAKATPADPGFQTCRQYVVQYKVAPGISWGNLPENLQRDWTRLNCDQYASDLPILGKQEVEAASEKEKARCDEEKQKYGIQPDSKNWGTAPTEVQEAWMFVGCDYYYFSAEDKAKIDNCDGKVQYDYRVAFITPLSTKGLRSAQLSTLPLWHTLLPSLTGTWASQRTIGFDFYFGFDIGDPLLDTEQGPKQFLQLFEDTMRSSLAVPGTVRMRLLRIHNGFTVGAPSWAVGALAQIAARDGVDYLFQVNDDTEMQTPKWSELLPDR